MTDRRGDAGLWVALAAGAAVIACAALVVAEPLSHVLFKPAGIHFFPIWTQLVHPKPVQETRYLLAVVLTILGAVALARAPLRLPGSTLLASAAKLATAVLAIWCFRRYVSDDRHAGVGHFATRDLAVGGGLAILVAVLIRRRPSLAAARPRNLAWPVLGVAITVCWLLPAVFRDRNVGHGLFVMWWHMQFVYGDFVATVGGRTPLVDYNAEYGSLLPVALAAPLRALGPSVGSFTALMCLLTLGSLLAVQRALALLTRSEPLALALYLPFLATGFFTDYHSGTERFYFGNYFGVFPLRYLGPYVLLWLCVRHLRGLRPRAPAWLFVLGTLATINDVEFGLPALAAAVVALAAAGSLRLRSIAAGVAAGALGVVAVLWLRTGQLIEVAHMTRYAQLFGRAGFGEVSTPTLGLHLVIYATFAGALVVAALRHRRVADDRSLTGALAFAGVFGLGAGSYYMGGSNPSQLLGVFSAWALAVALLALVAARALTRPGVPRFAAGAALVLFGLQATALTQFPAPWTQVRRITAGPAATQPYDRTAAAAYVRRTAAPGEHVVVLEGLGQLVALRAGVENVSPYSEIWAVWSHEQVAEIVGALRRAGGTRFYLGRAGADPGIGVALAADGFKRVGSDAASELTLWRL